METVKSSAAKAFPLAWPKGQPRTKVRGNSKFGDRTVAVTYKLLKKELNLLGAQYLVVSSNVPLKANGDPYSDPGRMPDPGVAVYFQLKGKPYCLPCDRWLDVEDNLYAVAKHIEAMRGMDRWGVGSIEQTFAGFRELPASTEKAWHDVLGVAETATADQIRAAHRALAMAAHPDRGGSAEQMQALNVARDVGLIVADH